MEVEDDRLAQVLGELGRAVEARGVAVRAAQARAQHGGAQAGLAPERESARQAELRTTLFKRGMTKG